MEFFFNICCLIASLIAVFGGIRFWKSYEKTKIAQFENFSLNFLFLSIAYILLFLPNLILFNPFLIQINFILIDLSFLAAELFLITATLSFLKFSVNIQKMFFWTFFSIITAYVALNIIFFAPAISLFSEGIGYWKNGVFWLHSIAWVPAATGAGIVGCWFLLESRKIKDRKLSWRSFFFGLTGFFIFVAGILFWYFKFFNPSPTALAVSGIIGDMGFLSGVIGSFFYQSFQEDLVKKIN